jgi:hypothetical protein
LQRLISTILINNIQLSERIIIACIQPKHENSDKKNDKLQFFNEHRRVCYDKYNRVTTQSLN